ncbi:MAG: hypothetical protein U0411_12875 [Thermodesulfovibrionales bacterium]
MPLVSLIRKAVRFLQKTKHRMYIRDLVKKGLLLGKDVAFVEDIFLDPSHCFLISIGDHCTLCPRVRLIAHDASPKRLLGYTKIGKIAIRENCFIGDSAIILPNVTIGPFSIVGAGSVVTRDIPPYTVAAGNPARVICSVDEYVRKIRDLRGGGRVFDEGYSIERLDKEKQREMVRSIGNTVGFIV